jgi:hypothetical protein
MSSTNPGPATTTGANNLGGGSPMLIGDSATSLVGFYGTAQVAQRASADQAALTLTTVATSTAAYGFSSSTAFSAFIAQLEEIRATLAALGIFKGAA